MKTRVRQLANDKWVCELKRWWHGWRVVYFMELTTQFSMRNGHSAKSLCTEAPGSDHYPTMWKSSEWAARMVEDEILAYFGKGKESSKPREVIDVDDIGRTPFPKRARET